MPLISPDSSDTIEFEDFRPSYWQSSRVIAYEELGPEAIRELEVEDLPAVVVNDVHGNDLYKRGREKYSRA